MERSYSWSFWVKFLIEEYGEKIGGNHDNTKGNGVKCE